MLIYISDAGKKLTREFIVSAWTFNEEDTSDDDDSDHDSDSDFKEYDSDYYSDEEFDEGDYDSNEEIEMRLLKKEAKSPNLTPPRSRPKMTHF